MANRAQVLGVPLALLAVLLALPVGRWLRRWWRRGGPVTAEQLDAAAAYLAHETLTYWRAEAGRRGIRAPSPLRVRWQWAGPDVAVPASDLASPRILSAGEVTRLVEDLYLKLAPGERRLVLLGGPGVGKTAAMLLLLIEVLERRAAAGAPSTPTATVVTAPAPPPSTAQAGAVEPVPVWLTLGSWNPGTTGLADYAARTLLATFPSLGHEDYGGPVAVSELLGSGRVALFLDGLDEMPDAWRAAALAGVEEWTRARAVPVVLDQPTRRIPGSVGGGPGVARRGGRGAALGPRG